MAYAVPNFSRKQITRAGNVLVNPGVTRGEFSDALELINYWRACHAYPVNTFQATLRSRLKRLGFDFIVATRLKRIPSIEKKLLINPGMQLARMQDVGGLRAIVSSTRQVRALQDIYSDESLTHELIATDDYILNPKKSGYRSVHLIYKYRNPLSPKHDGLCLELQIRTKVQHMWATAVETVGTFLNQALKSSEGEEAWLEYFRTVGAAFAVQERSPVEESFANLSRAELYDRVRTLGSELDVRRKLDAFSVAAQHINNQSTGSYHLIVLNAAEKTVEIRSFGKRRLEEANAAYANAEKAASRSSQDVQPVLVATDSMHKLRRAYPNYFLDTKEFLRAVGRIETSAFNDTPRRRVKLINP